MDLQLNFEYLCRVCAANTKGKRSVAECVYIMKTPGLKDKIERHLYLTINPDDLFPKVLCKSCFRQVEATASLSNIAKHTQQVFRDFLLSTMPKHTQPHAPIYNEPIVATNDNRQQAASRTSDEFRPIMLTKTPETTITLAPVPNPQPNRDEVVISLTKKNNETLPRTKNTAIQQRRNSVFDTRFLNAPVSIAQRGLLLPPTAAPPLVPTTTKITKTAPTPPTVKPTVELNIPSAASVTVAQESAKSGSKNVPAKKTPSPSGVINFIQTHGKVTGSANGLGVLNNKPTSVIQQKRRNLQMALNNIKAVNSGQVSLLKSKQHRPRHPNPILETESQKTVSVTTVLTNKTMDDETTCIEECLPENIIIAAPKRKKEETLAKQPPQQQTQQQPTQTQQTQTLAPPPPPLVPALTKIMPPKLQVHQSTNTPPPLTQLASKTKTLPKLKPKPEIVNPVSSLTDGISLGSVIRDPDLLKLILKSLQWPVHKANFEQQMTRLKNSKFAEIISDTKLLQDTDMTQLLGPYIAPVLRAAQALQQQPTTTTAAAAVVDQAKGTAAAENTTKSKSTTPPTLTKTTAATTSTQAAATSVALEDLTSGTDLASAMPYKLPPETSVQLVPSSPTEQDVCLALTSNNSSSNTTNTRSELSKQTKPGEGASTSRSQRKMRGRESSLVISREDDCADKTTSATTTNSDVQFSLNALIMAQCAQQGSADTQRALQALLQTQQQQQQQQQQRRGRDRDQTRAGGNSQRVSSQRRRRRSTSPRNAADTINLEDIVLMEPQPALLQPPELAIPRPPTPKPTTVKKPSDVELALMAFKLPTQQPPVITRPIIKRRKTVIQSSKPRADSSVTSGEETKTTPPIQSEPIEEKPAKVEPTNKSSPPASPSPSTSPTPTRKALQLPSSTVPESGTHSNTSTTTPPSSVTTTATTSSTSSLLLSSSMSASPTTTTTTTTSTPSSSTTITTTTPTTTPSITTTVDITKKSPNGTAADNTTAAEKASATSKPLATGNKKSGLSKSALGQQLLQAIGLQKVGNGADNEGQPLAENSRDSLRSALKRSLKQAQEQQMKRVKQGEPVKQLADSTTKSVARESIEQDEKQKQHEQDQQGETEKEATKRNRNKPETEEPCIKDEKPEQANVSSSDMTPRRRGRKRKEDNNESGRQSKQEMVDQTDDRWDDDDDLPLKTEKDTPSRSSSRPARTSKTMSKYYKGPEKAKPSHVMGTRASRNR